MVACCLLPVRRRLREAAAAFDERLRTGLSEPEVSQLETLLTRLRGNVDASHYAASGTSPGSSGPFGAVRLMS